MAISRLLVLLLGLAPTGLAAADAEVMAELARRSSLPMMEILPALDHCHRSQHTRNVCAYYTAIGTEMALDRLVAETGYPAPEAYAALKQSTQEGCVTRVRARTPDAALHPERISLCIADAFAAERGRVINGGALFPLHAPGPVLNRSTGANLPDDDDD